MALAITPAVDADWKKKNFRKQQSSSLGNSTIF
jgi:hypothetical protein